MRRATKGVTVRISKRASPAQIRQLFLDAGWTEDVARYSDQKVRRSLNRSHMVVTAWNQKKLVGYASVVSDGALCAFVDNLVVHPGYRSFGLGTRILRELVRALQREKVDYIFILGAAGRGSQTFFRRAGFQPLRWKVFLHAH